MASKSGDDGIVPMSPSPSPAPPASPAMPSPHCHPYPTACAPCARAAGPAASRHGPAAGRALRGQGTAVSTGTQYPPSLWTSVPPCHGFAPGTVVMGTLGTRGSHQTGGGPGAARRCHPRAGRTSSSSGARGCSGAGAGGLRAREVMLGDGGDRRGQGGDRELLLALTEQVHLQDGFLGLGWRETEGEVGVQPLSPCRVGVTPVPAQCPSPHPHLLGDDGVVVLQDEPLDVVGPQALLLHALGLDGGQGRQWGQAEGSLGCPLSPLSPYLQAVLLFAVLVVSQAEAERVPRALDQHQRRALQGEASSHQHLVPSTHPIPIPAPPGSPSPAPPDLPSPAPTGMWLL